MHDKEQSTETWETEGVSEISYNPETYKVLFQSTKAKPHAIIQVGSLFSSPGFQLQATVEQRRAALSEWVLLCDKWDADLCTEDSILLLELLVWWLHLATENFLLLEFCSHRHV